MVYILQVELVFIKLGPRSVDFFFVLDFEDFLI